MEDDRDQLLEQTERQASELQSIRKQLSQATDEATQQRGTMSLMQASPENALGEGTGFQAR